MTIISEVDTARMEEALGLQSPPSTRAASPRPDTTKCLEPTTTFDYTYDIRNKNISKIKLGNAYQWASEGWEHKRVPKMGLSRVGRRLGIIIGTMRIINAIRPICTTAPNAIIPNRNSDRSRYKQLSRTVILNTIVKIQYQSSITILTNLERLQSPTIR